MNETEQLQQRVTQLQTELAQYRRADEILHAIAQGTAGMTGSDFFYSFVYHLAHTLQVNYAFITECMLEVPNNVRTLAYWSKTDFVENFEYDLMDTPCEHVINSSPPSDDAQMIYFPNGLQHIYPEEEGIESYLGIALRDSTNRIIGHIVVMNDEPMQNAPFVHSALRIFAMRASAELQRKRAEVAVHDSEARYKLLFESTPLPVFVYNLETLLFLAVNKAAVRHYQYTHEQFLNLKFTDIIVPEDVPMVMDWLAEPHSAQQSTPITYRHIRRDGAVIDVETTLRILMFDGHSACLTLVNDVTDRKRIETERLLAYQTMERRVEARTREIQRRRQVAESLRDILALLNSNQTLELVLSYIVEQAHHLLKANAGAVYSFQGTRLLSQAAYMLDTDSDQSLPFLTEVMTHAIDTGLPIGISDVSMFTGRDVLLGMSRTVQRLLDRFRALLVVPVLIQKETYGCLLLYYDEIREFTDEEKELVVMFADQAALAVDNARLRKKAEEMAAMEERNRLARELHDAVSQTLWSAKLIADVLPDIWEQNAEKGRFKFKQFQQLTQAALVEMRSLLLELRPNALLETDLSTLLHRLTQSTTARTGIPVSVYISGESKLPDDVHIALYRITQEALNNVTRHSMATMAQVSLVYRDAIITLLITDNGRGFEPEAIATGHHGLTIMRERSTAIGAHLSIMSQVGHGTAVRLVWSPD